MTGGAAMALAVVVGRRRGRGLGGRAARWSRPRGTAGGRAIRSCASVAATTAACRQADDERSRGQPGEGSPRPCTRVRGARVRNGHHGVKLSHEFALRDLRVSGPGSSSVRRPPPLPSRPGPSGGGLEDDPAAQHLLQQPAALVGGEELEIDGAACRPGPRSITMPSASRRQTVEATRWSWLRSRPMATRRIAERTLTRCWSSASRRANSRWRGFGALLRWYRARRAMISISSSVSPVRISLLRIT